MPPSTTFTPTTETANLSTEHTAAVEQQALVKARQQTPGQLRTATRRAVVSADPTAARKRAEQARRERGGSDVARARRGDALVDLVLDPTSSRSHGTSTTREPTPTATDGKQNTTGTTGVSTGVSTSSSARDDVGTEDVTDPGSSHCCTRASDPAPLSW